MIRAKIEEYRVTKDKKVLDELKEAAKTSKAALAFLYTVEPETYKEALIEAAKRIAALERDADGLFGANGVNQEELLLDVMPLYTLYETKCNKKENCCQHYILLFSLNIYIILITCFNINN